MDKTLIIVLGIILCILIILNHITIISTNSSSASSSTNASCSQTAFGCCPNGVDSKVNFYGTNCPGYNPGPGYYPSQYIPPRVTGPAPIGGCAGTRYGCCPNNNTPKINPQGSNCVVKQ